MIEQEVRSRKPLISVEQADLVANVLIIIFSMLFASLFLSYILYRSREVSWPPMGIDEVPLRFPILSTLIVLLSSFFLSKSTKKLPETYNLVITLFLGLMFFVSQFFTWRDLKHHGIYVQDGIFSSILYAFSWVHAFHLFILILLYAFYLFSYFRKKNGHTFLYAIIVKLWHFLTVIWLLMFFGIFVF